MTADTPLASSAFGALIGRFAARTPTPGGGAAAGLVGALGASLAAMALRFSNPPGAAEGEHSGPADRFEEAAEALARAADQDCLAFEAVRSARRLPKATPEQKEARSAAVAEATLGAMEAPLAVLGRLGELAGELASRALAVKPALASDLASAAWCLRSAAEMAWLNVCINAEGLPEVPRARSAVQEGKALLARLRAALSPLLEKE